MSKVQLTLLGLSVHHALIELIGALAGSRQGVRLSVLRGWLPLLMRSLMLLLVSMAQVITLLRNCGKRKMLTIQELN
jgi:hypothetical protein